MNYNADLEEEKQPMQDRNQEEQNDADNLIHSSTGGA